VNTAEARPLDDRIALSSEEDNLSPYRVFAREEWARLRADTPLTLTAEEVLRLQSLNDPISLEEVVAIYLPLSRLLSLYVAATQGLFKATQRFLLAENDFKVPYIIGIAGSVAVGKSTTARVLTALLARWPNTPKVDLVTTDGFLHSNAELTRLGLMERKGFPESYDTNKLLHFLADIKAGKRHVKAPLYSHLVYDVVPGEETVVDRPDILIVEGLNVLQPARMPKDGTAIPFVSDYFDFSVYIDADEADLHRWYVNRFLRLRHTSFRDPLSYFRRYAEISETEAIEVADGLWNRINLLNLRENILPTRQRASLILRKGASHRIEEVALRRL
jgi:type I pantothenate kinase